MTALPAIARVIRKVSLALPINHPDQGALQAAHAVLLSPTAAALPQGVDHSHSVAASAVGREFSR